MNLTKSTLMLAVLFIGINIQAAQVSEDIEDVVVDLSDVQNAVEKHLIPDVARITTEYVDRIIVAVYPTDFTQFCELDKYRQWDIIKAFGMVNPDAECARVSRRRLDAGIDMGTLCEIPVSIFDGKKEKERILTGYGESLGYIEQKRFFSSWPNLQKTIVCWTKITQENRKSKLSHEQLVKLMQSYRTL